MNRKGGHFHVVSYFIRKTNVAIHGVYPDKLNSHILNGTKVRQNCSDNRNGGADE